MSIKSPTRLLKKKDMKMNKLKIQNKNTDLLDNRYFKRFVYSAFITSTIIMTLGYVQPSRDLSKVDDLKDKAT
jgi:hypothetical protein